MSTVDLLTMCSFAAVLLLGVMTLVLQDIRKNQPDARIKARMQLAFALSAADRKTRGTFESDLFSVIKRDNVVTRWTRPKLARLNTVAGAKGLRIVIGAAIAGELLALAMTTFMPLPDMASPILMTALPLFCGAQAYRILIERFRKRFLDFFPDVIDMIVRAVRAGVPVTHVIGAAADECPDPLRREFKLMSDALQVGLDLEEVLAVAVRRIEIADFSFFCVCLLLQRETGGQLGETLENLAGIVRTRREIRQKTQALTGEARITTKILAAIPVVIMLSMYVLNRDYLAVLFGTPAGHKLMTFASISITIGLMVVNKMSKLDTSR
ncbi:secretion system protein [Burkholderia sp. Leaf177]|uniref:type II secretion system F family protein n=1 Tax=Burkholderia sp. Leaf177 TaxID=1736287 RepID=UPI0006F86126|nr:type II secretion system F family protein [Burkholderia sp. Leaf177]KQR81503.1 secretion system protein [Burkholderia sp. Leaf177]